MPEDLESRARKDIVALSIALRRACNMIAVTDETLATSIYTYLLDLGYREVEAMSPICLEELTIHLNEPT